MASNSEITFGARLNNAEKLFTHLQSFTGYAPPNATQSAANLGTLITNIKTQNNSAAGDAQSYSAAVEKRQRLFQKDNDSLVKIMSPIAAAIRAAFGKTSKEAADITSMVTKIRGEKVKKSSTEPNAEFVSQSEKSYGSMTQNFADMIATLAKYDGNYKPANDTIKLPALTDKLAQLTQANTDVAAAYGKLKETRDDRITLYKTLTDLIQRIKDAVKSQYGIKSTEYVLVKGLKV
jgi:hypothetical protein